MPTTETNLREATDRLVTAACAYSALAQRMDRGYRPSPRTVARALRRLTDARALFGAARADGLVAIARAMVAAAA
jgi:hypothetical protein